MDPIQIEADEETLDSNPENRDFIVEIQDKAQALAESAPLNPADKYNFLNETLGDVHLKDPASAQEAAEVLTTHQPAGESISGIINPQVQEAACNQFI